MLMVGIMAVSTATFSVVMYQQKQKKKKRYKIEIDYAQLPKAGPRSAFVGNVAETPTKTYFDLDKFQIHTLVAGASGSGKTVAAQILVEEALLSGAGVAVFDPTATWTGFLRKLKDKAMLVKYPKYGKLAHVRVT